MRVSQVSIICLILLIAVSQCGCSTAGGNTALTPAQIKQFGKAYDTPPPSYYANLQKTRDWVKAHPNFKM